MAQSHAEETETSEGSADVRGSKEDEKVQLCG
jgi:hypothetical protein